MQTAVFGEDEWGRGLDGMTSPRELLAGGHHVLFRCSRSLVQHLARLLDGRTDGCLFAPEFQAWGNKGGQDRLLPALGIPAQ